MASELIGGEGGKIERLWRQINASVSRRLEVSLAFYLRQQPHCLIKPDPHMRVLLEAPGHQIQQLGAEAIPLSHVDEVIEHLAAVEALEGMRKHHRVYIHS